MAYRSFEELEVWQRACRLAVRVYEVLDGCRDYGLKDQLTRAAVSVASNIAEGAERGTVPDFIRFLVKHEIRNIFTTKGTKVTKFFVKFA